MHPGQDDFFGVREEIQSSMAWKQVWTLFNICRYRAWGYDTSSRKDILEEEYVSRYHFAFFCVCLCFRALING